MRDQAGSRATIIAKPPGGGTPKRLLTRTLAATREGLSMDSTQREVWRAIPNFTRYEVSNRGRVRSWIPWNGHRLPRMMKPSVATGGYPALTILDNDDRRRLRPVHILLAAAFIGPCPDGNEVRHLDDDASNCTLGNLCYGTHSENMADRVRNGRHFNANKTECKHGHPLIGENVFLDWRGMRQCVTCKNDHARRYTEQRNRSAAAKHAEALARERQIADDRGQHGWGEIVSPGDRRYTELLSGRSRARCKCGCGMRATLRGCSNGVAVTIGCRDLVSAWTISLESA